MCISYLAFISRIKIRANILKLTRWDSSRLGLLKGVRMALILSGFVIGSGLVESGDLNEKSKNIRIL